MKKYAFILASTFAVASMALTTGCSKNNEYQTNNGEIVTLKRDEKSGVKTYQRKDDDRVQVYPNTRAVRLDYGGEYSKEGIVVNYPETTFCITSSRNTGESRSEVSVCKDFTEVKDAKNQKLIAELHGFLDVKKMVVNPQ